MVTSPILPAEIEERLPSVGKYAPLEDHTGITDVRVRDNWAQTLHLAVWCHHLDMAVSDQESSYSLVRSRHQWGDLLAYFLGPGMAWKLTFEDVVTHVLWENRRRLDTKQSNAIASLHSCNQRWIML